MLNYSDNWDSKLRNTEFGRWLGGFVKDSIVNLAGIVALFGTGGIGAAAKIATTALGFTGDIHHLYTYYQQLKSDPNNTDLDILINMSTETLLLIAPKGVGKYISWLGKLIEKGLGKEIPSLIKITEAGGNTGQIMISSEIERNKKQKKK